MGLSAAVAVGGSQIHFFSIPVFVFFFGRLLILTTAKSELDNFLPNARWINVKGTPSYDELI